MVPTAFLPWMWVNRSIVFWIMKTLSDWHQIHKWQIDWYMVAQTNQKINDHIENIMELHGQETHSPWCRLGRILFSPGIYTWYSLETWGWFFLIWLAHIFFVTWGRKRCKLGFKFLKANLDLIWGDAVPWYLWPPKKHLPTSLFWAYFHWLVISSHYV